MHDKTSGYVIAILSNGKVLREDRGNVYLPFHSKYSVRIKNPKSTRVGVTVEIDGTDITNGKIILDGHSSFDLKRMILNDNLDRGPSLKFVPLSDSRVQDPTEPKNGLVTVRFYEESPPVYLNTYFLQQSYPRRNVNDWNTYGSSDHRDFRLYKNSSVTSPTDANIMFSCSSNGATIGGSDVNQSFVTTTFISSNKPTATLNLRLVGVNKAMTVNDTRRRFCPNCGSKVDFSHKFCSMCGKRIKREAR